MPQVGRASAVEMPPTNSTAPSPSANLHALLTRLLLLATVEVPVGGLPATEAAASASSSGGESAGGKKRKKAAAEAAASLLEALEFARPEEEVLAAAADWSTILNGAGRTRQLLLSLKPDAIRNAVPALHAVMDDTS